MTDVKESAAINKFCNANNIFYEKSPGDHTLHRMLAYRLSLDSDMKTKFENFDFFKEIVKVTVETDCSVLTFHVGWKHPHGYFKPQCEYAFIREDCINLFKKINTILKSIPESIRDNHILKFYHDCTAMIYDHKALFPSPTYWELICFKSKI